MSHLGTLISALIDGELAGTELDRANAHLAACDVCRTEAAQLRELGPGWPILLLSPLLPDEDRFVAEYDLAATVSTQDEVDRLDGAGKAAVLTAELRKNLEAVDVRQVEI